MFGTVIETAIGLTFVFLMFSLLVTTVQEAIAALVGLRAITLRHALARLLDQAVQKGQQQAAVDPSPRGPEPAAAPLPAPQARSVDILAHPLVRQRFWGPAYLSSANFSHALFDLLTIRREAEITFGGVAGAIDALPDGAAKIALQALVRQADGQIETLRHAVEDWFDHAMARTSGIYKRWAKVIGFCIGFVLAVVINVDSIGIERTLAGAPATREALASLATGWVDANAAAFRGTPATPAAGETAPARSPAGAPPVDPDLERNFEAVRTRYTNLQSELGSIGLPLGWPKGWPWQDPKFDWLTSVLGWLLTAVAAMLGAPFWFDTLQTFVNVRAAGPKPLPAAAMRSTTVLQTRHLSR
ncbi:hypothetical protein M0638_20325 [Roseomonas sp. NAR14]|uniref:Uncharacterized protein n=1 Tax=Roseomonas acroporae TaxID=2937791 RepID=A0A9X1YDI6_9PROT|nr:hypothetical protein [Roseomonas acroporae]MCK8786722.1 hypothetical protein [Roseomonas acroporae]